MNFIILENYHICPLGLNNYQTEKDTTLEDIRSILQNELDGLKNEIHSIKQALQDSTIKLKQDVFKTQGKIIHETITLIQNEL